MIDFLVMGFLLLPAQPQPQGPTEPPAFTTGQAPGAGEERPPLAPPSTMRAPVKIEAATFDVDFARSTGVFEKNVVVTRGPMRLTCDRLLAHYVGGAGPNARSVRFVECAGHVEFREGERVVTSERATYNALSGVVEMTGNPEAREGGNVFRGTKVTFTVGNRRMQWVQPKVLIETPEDAAKMAVPPTPPKAR